ncbi:MAG TPA: right-handed parallel beta-helix repeat-containing protein [Planctomycetota bacterium]|nr:right-handed parallel beta-helix repeat-containing protein [Planctomycetota bacterium]
MIRSSVLRGAAAALLLAAALPAQLSGVYTVDNTQPTAGTNFNTLIDAAAALTSQGVAGSTIFQVVNTGTPYAGFSIVAPVVGASTTNTITFVGIGLPTVSGVAAGFVQTIRLGTNSVSAAGSGPSDITIDGFDVTGAASGAGIIVSQCQRISILNCVVHNSGSGIDINASTFCTVEGNEVYQVGVTTGAPGSSTYAGGISVYYNAHNTVVNRNRVHDCTNQGIFVGSSGSATAPLTCTVTNNMVWNCPGTGTYAGGIALRRGTTTCANNSVSMPAGTAAPGIHQMGSSADPQATVMANNIIQHSGSGPCFRFETATTTPAGTMDNNLYDVLGTGSVAQAVAVNHTLASFQAAFPGKDVSSLATSAGFVGPTDLHILPSSAAFNAGLTLAAVPFDLDGDPRPLGGNYDIGADEAPASGLFSNFSANVTAGPAPLSVTFTDLTFSSAGPVTSYAWDFQNDGIVDSTAANPTFVYQCPGVYSVSLTTTDGVNPPSTVVKSNYITATQFQFDLFTSGGGVGDLVVTPVPTTCGAAAGGVIGYTLLTFTTPGPVGSGPMFGIVPDAITLFFLQTPLAAGNPLAFVALPGLYPNGGPLSFPAGTMSGFAGLSMDGVEVVLSGTGALLYWSNVDRCTF